MFAAHLLSIELHKNGLSGEPPLELLNISKLQLLNVAEQYTHSYRCKMSNGTEKLTPCMSAVGRDSGVNRPISEELGDLQYLDEFDASSHLSCVVYLRAQNNQFDSSLPVKLGELKELHEAFLDRNNLHSVIPTNIGTMEDLEVLKLNENEMRGTIPESLCDLEKLKQLWLHDTMSCEGTVDGLECNIDLDTGFSGTINTKIGNLKNLTEFFIQNNPFSGTIPTQIGLCEDLATIHMHKTNIGGSSPNELCALRDKNLNNELLGIGAFSSDCRPNNKIEDPFSVCHCCSYCCDHTTMVCIAED
ncbi:hypothetical protein ACHAXR_005909 [Thalassiosira sp. AJA248-18]